MNKDIQDYALVTGNPAKQLGWVCACGVTIKAIGNRHGVQGDNDQGPLICPSCGNQYIVMNGTLESVKEK